MVSLSAVMNGAGSWRFADGCGRGRWIAAFGDGSGGMLVLGSVVAFTAVQDPDVEGAMVPLPVDWPPLPLFV